MNEQTGLGVIVGFVILFIIFYLGEKIPEWGRHQEQERIAKKQHEENKEFYKKHGIDVD